jgi:hypothetical protein
MSQPVGRTSLERHLGGKPVNGEGDLGEFPEMSYQEKALIAQALASL